MAAILKRRRKREAISLRAASQPIYQGGGPSSSPMLVVPRLEPEYRTRDATRARTSSNPFTYGPVFETAFRIGALPIKVFRYRIVEEQAIKTEAPDHRAYALLRRPNPVLTRSLMISGTVQSMIVLTQAAWLKVRDPQTREVGELWPLDARFVMPIRSANEMISAYRVSVPNNAPVTLAFDDVCFFKLVPDVEDWAAGASAYQALSRVAAMGSDAIDREASIVQSGMMGRTWVDLQGKTLTEPSLNRLQAAMRVVRESNDSPVMEDGALIKDMAAPADDVLRTGMEQATLIAKMTMAMDNADEKAFYGRVVQPIADAIEQELERSLFPEWPNDPAFAEFGFREILKGDPEARARLHQIKIFSAQETPDEARLDDGKAPLANGAGSGAYLPLNTDRIEDIGTSPPRATDTGEGMGGDQGKGMVGPTPGTGAQRARSRKRPWGRLREKTLEAQRRALNRRLRGIVNEEKHKILALFSEAQRAPGLPSEEELLAILKDADPKLEKQLRAFMAQTSNEAWDAALDLIAAENIAISENVARVIEERASVVVDRFGVVRSSELQSLFAQTFEQQWDSRTLANSISELYTSLADHYVDGIARTEVAFAHETAALTAWQQHGIEMLDFVFGGGPCTTGICEDAEADSPYDIRSAEEPPLHPNCTCFLVPSEVT